MRFNHLAVLTVFGLSQTVIGDAVPFERLNKNDTVLLIVDLQVGLTNIVRDYAPTEFVSNMLAHASLGKLFGMPTILTTSAEQGPNGPLPKEITEMYPDAPYIRRQGEVDAWDNADFRAAVQATGKKQVIMAGITTDVCTTFLALSLRAEGYSVWANTEASGTTSERIASDANSRMAGAGVQLVSLFAIAMDLMRDWRNTRGAAELLPWLDRYYPVYGYVARAHGAATLNGTIQPGQAAILPGGGV
ncbi:hypothetical protein MMC16_006546 [Acarospora aff. strigata]|nr:hypothetical protein [Acarospora aff. strigata]